MGDCDSNSVRRTRRLGSANRPLPGREAALMAQLYRAGRPIKYLMRRFHRGNETVIRALHAQGVAIRSCTRDDCRDNPTPEEIEARARVVREHWSDEEYQRRAGLGDQAPYTVPECLFLAHLNRQPIVQGDR